MSPIVDLVQSVVDMPGKFVEVAMQGPVEATLVLFGAIFIAVPSAVFGYLVLGAAVDLVKPGQTGTRHP